MPYPKNIIKKIQKIFLGFGTYIKTDEYIMLLVYNNAIRVHFTRGAHT
jgi:hypothetical protein